MEPYPPTSLTWFSSRDGELGTGNNIEVILSAPEEGTSSHIITLSAIDSEGKESIDQIQVLVGRIL